MWGFVFIFLFCGGGLNPEPPTLHILAESSNAELLVLGLCFSFPQNIGVKIKVYWLTSLENYLQSIKAAYLLSYMSYNLTDFFGDKSGWVWIRQWPSRVWKALLKASGLEDPNCNGCSLLVGSKALLCATTGWILMAHDTFWEIWKDGSSCCF